MTSIATTPGLTDGKFRYGLLGPGKDDERFLPTDEPLDKELRLRRSDCRQFDYNRASLRIEAWDVTELPALGIIDCRTR